MWKTGVNLRIDRSLVCFLVSRGVMRPVDVAKSLHKTRLGDRYLTLTLTLTLMFAGSKTYKS